MKYHYWVLSEKGEYWISSKSLLDSSNDVQMEWVQRETDPSISLLVYIGDKRSNLWMMPKSRFLEWVQEAFQQKMV